MLSTTDSDMLKGTANCPFTREGRKKHVFLLITDRDPPFIFPLLLRPRFKALMYLPLNTEEQNTELLENKLEGQLLALKKNMYTLNMDSHRYKDSFKGAVLNLG